MQRRKEQGEKSCSEASTHSSLRGTACDERSGRRNTFMKNRICRLTTDIPILSGLGNTQLADLLNGATRKSFAKHTLLIQEGSPSDALYMIERGKAKVFLASSSGKEVILSVLGPGEYVGEMALIDDEPHSAGVMTLTDTDCLVVSKVSFKDHLAKNTDIAIALLRQLSQRLREADQCIGSLALMDVCGRVAHALLRLAKPLGNELV